MGMGVVDEALQIGVLVLILIALMVALLVVWHDDKKWMDGDSDPTET